MVAYLEAAAGPSPKFCDQPDMKKAPVVINRGFFILRSSYLKMRQ